MRSFLTGIMAASLGLALVAATPATAGKGGDDQGIKSLLARYGYPSIEALERAAENNPQLKAEMARLEECPDCPTPSGIEPPAEPQPIPGLPIGPDGFGYVADNITYGFIDISGTGTNPGVWGDDNFFVIPIGFTFVFYGNSYTSVRMASNGYLTFGGRGTDYSNDCPIRNTARPDTLVAPFWDDLNAGSTGVGYYQLFGSSPSRYLVLQWNQFQFFGDTAARLTFEVILYEGSNRIEYHYSSLTATDPSRASGNSATCGIEDIGSDATRGLNIFCNTAGSVGGGDAVGITIQMPAPNPPTDVTVDESADTMFASWTNGATYDSIQVTVASPDTTVTLPGGATSATIGALPAGFHTVSVVGFAAGTPSLPGTCTFMIGPIGPDGFGHIGDNTAAAFIDISGTGTDIGISGDDVGAVIAIGFPFQFYGVARESVGVASNGYLAFGGESLTDYTNDPIPSSVSPNNLIAPFWDDLYGVAPGVAYYEVQGTQPNRRLIIQWKDFQFFGGTGARLNFEVILHEGTNQVEFQYSTLIGDPGNPAQATGSSATVGIESADGLDGVQLANDDACFLNDGDAFTITPPAPIPPPTIAGVDPIEGCIGGGDQITISGSDFQAGATVTVGGNALIDVEILPLEIRGITPPGAAGLADITVTNPDGQSDTLVGGFLYRDMILPLTVTPDEVTVVTGDTVEFDMTLANGCAYQTELMQVGIVGIGPNGGRKVFLPPTPNAGFLLGAHSSVRGVFRLVVPRRGGPGDGTVLVAVTDFASGDTVALDATIVHRVGAGAAAVSEGREGTAGGWFDSWSFTLIRGFEGTAGAELAGGISAGPRIPTAYSLGPNFPNPFNPSTTLSFGIPASQTEVPVRLRIFTLRGELVRSLVDEVLPPGEYTVRWDGRSGSGEVVGSGIYVYRLEAGSYTATRKMVVLK